MLIVALIMIYILELIMKWPSFPTFLSIRLAVAHTDGVSATEIHDEEQGGSMGSDDNSISADQEGVPKPIEDC